MTNTTTIYYASAPHPCGWLLAGVTSRGLCYAGFGTGETLAHHFPEAQLVQDKEYVAPWLDKIKSVLDGTLSPSVLALDIQGTPFQHAVWDALLAIPYGHTVSYAQLAIALGNPGAARAVGSACGANPVAIVIPCHRVLASDGSLGGFAYGLETKQRMLEWEASRRSRLDGESMQPAVELPLQRGIDTLVSSHAA